MKIISVLKLQLNIEDITSDFFTDSKLLGIISSSKNYHFCWQVNNKLGFNFRLNPSIEVQLKKKGRSYQFNVYQYQECNSYLNHYLYHNHYDGEYLLPEFRYIDYLWLLKDDIVEADYFAWMIGAVKRLHNVQMVTEVQHDKLKNKSNLIF